MKTTLYHLLRTFRWLVVPILKLLSGLFVVMFLVALFSGDAKVAGFGKALLWLGFAVGFGYLSWGYDILMKKCEPVSQINQTWS